jgi:hypothetical protein
MLKIPTTSRHKLSAERVYRVTMALVSKLIEKGVLPPTAAQTPITQPDPPEGLKEWVLQERTRQEAMRDRRLPTQSGPAPSRP